MSRFLTAILWCGGCVLWLTGIGISAEVSRPSETLLPKTTQGFFAISNVDKLKEQWNKTQLGHLMAEPVMEPFVKDIRRQFEARWSSVHDRLGVTLDDLKGVPGGEVAIGLVAPGRGKAALAMVIDVSGKLPRAKEMLKTVTARQLERGAKRKEAQLKGCPDPIIQFDLPQPEEEKEASRSTLPGSDKADKAAAGARAVEEEIPARQAFYCLTGNLLVVTDNFEIIKGILGRAMKGQRQRSLAEHKPFQVVIDRCKTDHGDGAPQIRWFINPLGYAEAARAATPEDRRRKGKSILEVMRNQGLGAVQGVGGMVDFAAEGREIVHRTAIYAPPPYEKSMKMAVLPNEKDFAPQPWVPREIATYTTLYFDILNAFDNFDSLADEVLAQGERDVWKEIKLNLRDDPNGPQIDLRKELMEHLGQRVSVLTDYRLPITTSSDRLMIVIDVKNPKAVAAAIEKLLKNDPTFELSILRRVEGKFTTEKLSRDDPKFKQRKAEGLAIWEAVEDKSDVPQPPEVSGFGDAPVVTPVHPPKKRILQRKGEEEEEEEEEPRKLLPHMAITVWEGNLLIASHMDFLLKIIASAKELNPLGDDAHYLVVDQEIGKLQPKEKCARVFSRTDEEYRPTYELVRQNKMPESEGMLARALNALFGEGKKGAVRRQKIDGSQLPEYEVVRRHLGPAGLQATSEPKGWFLKGFTLAKTEEKAEEGSVGGVQSSGGGVQGPAVKVQDPPTKVEGPGTKVQD